MEPRKQTEAVLLTLLFLAALFFWTAPLRASPIPYGEVDAASHYAVAEYTYSTDRSITLLPYYIDERYGDDNVFRPHTLWYAPPFHTSLAAAAVLGGSADVPILLLNAVFALLILLSTYLLMRRLFGFEAAFLSSALLIFSLRDLMVFLWGQWPERMGFAYVPAILYCFCRYAESCLEETPQSRYLGILTLLLASNFFIHPMTFFHSLAALGFSTLFLIMKRRAFPFPWKPLALSAAVFALLLLVFPFQTMNALFQTGDAAADDPGAVGTLSRLFSWSALPTVDQGVPASYFSFRQMVAPWWSVPFLLLGILYILLKRDTKHLVMLGWLAGLYLMVHLDIIGKGRVHRSLSETAHIFYPLIVLGIFFALSFLPQFRERRSRFWGALVVTALLISALAPPALEALRNAYPPLARATPQQLEAASWMRSSLPEEATVFHLGSLMLSKSRWIAMLSHRNVLNQPSEKMSYVLADSSDFALLGNVQALEGIRQAEAQINASPLYSTPQQQIKVYALGTG